MSYHIQEINRRIQTDPKEFVDACDAAYAEQIERAAGRPCAELIEGGPDHDAALKSPGQVIERGLSIDPGEIKPARKPKGPSAASRRKVEALEAELAELDERQAEEADALEAEAKALAKRQADLEKRHGSERDRLRNRLKAARDKV